MDQWGSLYLRLVQSDPLYDSYFWLLFKNMITNHQGSFPRI
jgi:hypothetical protein